MRPLNIKSDQMLEVPMLHDDCFSSKDASVHCHYKSMMVGPKAPRIQSVK